MPPSNFRIGDPQGAYWDISYLAPDGARVGHRCRVNGFQFIRALQQRLADEPVAATFDGNRYGGAAVAADGKWGPITSRVLWNAVRRLGGDQNLLTALAFEAGYRGRARAVTGSVGRGSLMSAIWLLHQQPLGPVAGGVPLTAVGLPEFVPPEWGRTPTIPVGVDLPGITCEFFGYEEEGGAPPVSQPVVPPPEATPASTPAPTPQPVDQDTTDDIRGPDGLSRYQGPGSQVPWGAVLIFGVFVALAVASQRGRGR